MIGGVACDEMWAKTALQISSSVLRLMTCQSSAIGDTNLCAIHAERVTIRQLRSSPSSTLLNGFPGSKDIQLARHRRRCQVWVGYGRSAVQYGEAQTSN
jgi:hypothetical protein